MEFDAFTEKVRATEWNVPGTNVSTGPAQGSLMHPDKYGLADLFFNTKNAGQEGVVSGKI